MNLLFLLRNNFKRNIELNLVRDVKNHKKGFYRYTSQKTQIKENIPSLINENWLQQTWRRLRYLNKFSALVFTESQASHIFHDTEPPGRGWRSKTLSLKEKRKSKTVS